MAALKNLEHESDAPENWTTDTVLERDVDGNVHEVDVPDDPDTEEVSDDAGND